MAAKIKCNDEVIVISGQNKGKKGKVKHIFPSKRVVIEGINLVKKHKKSIPSLNQPGGIFEKEASIHISNIAIFNVVTGKADRIGFRYENNKKVRFFKSNKKTVS